MCKSSATVLGGRRRKYLKMARHPWSVLVGRPWSGFWRLAFDSHVIAVPGEGVEGTFFYPMAPDSFERIDIHPLLPLFEGPWAYALLTYASALVRPGGEVRIPITTRLGKEWIESHMHRDVRLAPVPRVGDATMTAIVSGDGPTAPAVPSTLTWSVTGARELLCTAAAASGADEAASWLGELPAHLERGERLPTQPADVSTLVKRHAYFVSEISFKAPVLAHLIRTLLSGRKDVTITDIGGGFGLLGAELLLDRAISPAAVVVVDKSEVNAALAARLGDWLHDVGVGGLSFVQAAAESETEISEADLVVAIGSLLYVPREQLPATLRRMWNAVRDGGLLVVHENMKHRSFVNDYDKMFEPQELDGYLAPFGAVRYFSSTALRELEPHRIGRSAAFRVVQKARGTRSGDL